MLSTKFMETIPQSIRVIRKLVSHSLYNDLTFQQFRVLALTHEGMGQTQMAQNMHISMAAVSKMVDRLVKMKLMEREQCEDRRCFKLTLTKEGEKIRKTIREQVGKELEKSFKKLTKKEQEELTRGFEVLAKLIGIVNEK
jgi:DNA-binding MarR family transcriptional regulator